LGRLLFITPEHRGKPQGDRLRGCSSVVEHHLAKVRVAGSSPVIRSETPLSRALGPENPSMVGWPRGEAAACKAVYTGSNPVPTSQARRALGAAVARFPDTEEVTGSIAVSPTSKAPDHVVRGLSHVAVRQQLQVEQLQVAVQDPVGDGVERDVRVTASCSAPRSSRGPRGPRCPAAASGPGCRSACPGARRTL